MPYQSQRTIARIRARRIETLIHVITYAGAVLLPCALIFYAAYRTYYAFPF